MQQLVSDINKVMEEVKGARKFKLQ